MIEDVEENEGNTRFRNLCLSDLASTLHCLKLLVSTSDFLDSCNEDLGSESLLDESFEGYRYLIVTCLFKLGLDVVLCPRFLDLEEDATVRDIWSKKLPAYGEYPGSSLQGLSLKFIWGLRSSVLKARSWSELEVQCQPLSTVAETLLNVLEKAFEFEHPGTGEVISLTSEDAFRVLAPSFCLESLGHCERLQETYFEMYRPSGKLTFKRVVALEKSAASWMTRDRSEEIATPRFYIKGIAVGLWYLWKTLLFDQQSRINNIFLKWVEAKDWSESHDCYRTLGKAVSKEVETSHDVRFTVQGDLQIHWQDIIGHSPEEGKTEDFQEAFLGHPIRIVNTHYGQAPCFMEILIWGLVSVCKGSGQKARILRLKAPLDDASRMSYAFLMEAYGPLSTACEWWVFYAIAIDEDTDLTHRKMQMFFDNYSDVLDVTDIEYDEKEFVEFAKPKHLRRASNLIEDVHKFVKEARGAYLELLVALWLHHEGWGPIRVGRNYRCLKGRDLDVVALKESGQGCELLTVECKGLLEAIPIMGMDEETGEYDYSPDMIEVLRFKDKVELIVRNPEPLVKEAFGIESVSNVAVTGLVISRTPTSVRVDSAIPEVLEHLSWDSFLEALRKNKIPRRLYDPLTHEVVKEYLDSLREIEEEEYPTDE